MFDESNLKPQIIYITGGLSIFIAYLKSEILCQDCSGMQTYFFGKALARMEVCGLTDDVSDFEA